MKLYAGIGCIALIFNNRFQFISYIQFMKVLVTGANGLLGQHLIRQLVDEGKFVIHATGKGPSRLSYGEKNGVTYHQLDITDFKRSQALVEKISPHILIHAAAVTQPNDCAADKTTCWKTNVGATRTLLKAAQKAKSYFIYVSTDFVFEGNEVKLLKEDDVAKPINVYGQTKLDGELALAKILPQHYIIRTSWLYSEYANNFVKTMLKLGAERDELNIIADQVGTPTYAIDLANAIFDIIALGNENYGTYHYSNEGVTSWFDFAAAIFAAHRLKVSLQAVSSSSWQSAVSRPQYSVLDCSKFSDTFAIAQPQWQNALAQLTKENA